MNKKCQQCKKEFSKAYNTSVANFSKQKFCSQKCCGDSKIGVAHPHSEEQNKKIGLANKNNRTGLKNGKYTRFKKATVSAKDKIGGEAKYRSIHKWVERQLGKPSKCSQCGGVGYGRQIHWANISKEYKKELGDWTRLCAKCHYEFDTHRKILPVNKQTK